MSATKHPQRKARRQLGPVDQLAEVRRQYPGVLEHDWHDILADDRIFGRVLTDICKIGWAPAQRRGTRAELDYATFIERLRALAAMRRGEFSTLPFHEAFALLADGRSVRHLATKTGMPRTSVHRLLSGEHDPAAEEMERVARAFDVSPMFFVEYRTAAVLATMAEHLLRSPEATVGLVHQLGLDRAAAQAS